MPRGLRPGWESVMRYGPIILFGLIAFGGLVLSRPINAVSSVLYGWVLAIATA